MPSRLYDILACPEGVSLVEKANYPYEEAI